MSTLTEAQVFLDGSHYKIGRLGKPYILINDIWVLSTRSSEEVEHAIDREKKRALS